jgi:molybdopterin molybdotransferase
VPEVKLAFDWEHTLEIVLEAARVKEVETMDMTTAVGRILAAPVVASLDLPPFNRSSVDGYAVRVADISSPPALLRIAGTITAGSVPKSELQSGQCMKIMTGAMLPPGADAVIPVEKVIVKGADIEIAEAKATGYCCTFQGAEFTKGMAVLSAGVQIGAAEVGLMAAVGMQQVQVYKAPTVALIVTGDELVEPWVNPRSGQIHNSNAYSLLALFRLMGIATHYLGICPDSLPALSDKILSGMQDDIVVIVGGSAKGEKDFLHEALDSLGMEIVVDGTGFKPGSTTVFARRKMCLIMGLPGPPGAMRTVFHLVLYPVLRKMMGHRKPKPDLYTGIFKGGFTKPEGVEFFLGIRAEFANGKYVLEQIKGKSHTSWEAWKLDNALARIPQNVREVRDGEELTFLFIHPSV